MSHTVPLFHETKKGYNQGKRDGNQGKRKSIKQIKQRRIESRVTKYRGASLFNQRWKETFVGKIM